MRFECWMTDVGHLVRGLFVKFEGNLKMSF